MLCTWSYVEDELLLVMYRKAVEQNWGREFIDFIFDEIKNRNLITHNPVHLISQVENKRRENLLGYTFSSFL